MPRYDFMHWSQRARDEEAATGTGAAPVPPQAVPTRQHAKPRATRPKPPRDEDAEHLLRLCHEGRLFALQEWVAAGKSLAVPAGYRRTPLRVAVDTGFHSLIEFLLQHETDQHAKDKVLQDACWQNRPGTMELALQHGAQVQAVAFQHVIETWDRAVVQLFVRHGADLVTNAPFARAFKGRVKAALGIYLDCRRARPELAEALQAQADVALRQACQDDDLKWVSLLMWLGANPRSKGLSTDDLDHADALDDPDYCQSALQIACGSRQPEILRRLKPDPALDDLRELMAAAASFATTPETVAYLVSLGANVNDRPDGGSTVLDKALQYFGWKEAVWDGPYGAYRRIAVPFDRLRASLEALRALLAQGARWMPDARAITEVRRALYRVDVAAIVAVIDLLRTYRACTEPTLSTLVAATKMRSLLATVRKSQPKAIRQATHDSGKARRPLPPPTPPPLPPSRYNRQRLYDEVWEEPTQKVAQRYGVSDVAIAKACALLGIPKPPRGYWAKKAAGRRLPARPPLTARS